MLNGPTLLKATSRRDRTFADDLAQEISLALRQTGYLELCNVDVKADGHDVLLCGCMPSYFLKQKAEYTTRSISGVATLKSDIAVTRG